MKAIYCILNKINGNRYIGSAQVYHRRKNLHIAQLEGNKHHSQYLQNAWNKHGKDNFHFFILEEVENADELLDREQWWLDNSPCDYNMCKIAGSSFGLKRSDETKEKIRQANLGLRHPEWRNKIKSESQIGEKHWAYGKSISDETKAKKSESMKKFFIENSEFNCKAVLKYDKNGTFIAEYRSIKEAANGIRVSASSITNNLAGRTKSAIGFVWKFKTKDKENEPILNDTRSSR